MYTTCPLICWCWSMFSLLWCKILLHYNEYSPFRRSNTYHTWNISYRTISTPSFFGQNCHLFRIKFTCVDRLTSHVFASLRVVCSVLLFPVPLCHFSAVIPPFWIFVEVSADNSFPDFRSPFPVPRSPFPVLVTSPITVKPVVRLRATLQYCHAMLVFWLAVCS